MLGGPESCGPNQQWDPNATFPGLPPGQCTPKGSAMTPAPTPGFFASFTSAMFPPTAKIAPATTPAFVPPAPQHGMSQGTMIAIGAGVVGLVAILMLTRN